MGPPAELAPFEKKTSVEGCGGGLQAAVFFPSSLWLEKRRSGGHRHGFWTIVWRIPYPILNQWVTSIFHPNLKIKFQLSSPPAAPPHSRKETSVSGMARASLTAMADPVAPAARLARSVSISISNPKRKRPKLGVSQNRSALTWAKGIQIEIEFEIVSRLLNLKHQTAEVSA